MTTALALSACATYQVGDASRSDHLKRFGPVPGKTSLYVCREPALLVARGVKTVVVVNNIPIGTLKTNSFVHAELEPGQQGVLLRHDGMSSGSGGFMTIDTEPGEVRYLWVGVTGNGWGVLTVDDFDSLEDAQECVRGAEYSVLGQKPDGG
ncbi:DUF2846 domain-containing protein [Luteimonas terricola]|uniref:DUF2846 domain-containing protein n=1 Tax=Luteimonas terricola TaxID=645597 RepID=UPI00104E3661|nr:DUF2846 domain-containing protein [Luteimonas terricola]